MRICVVTSHGIGEPRGPRHAIAAKVAFPEAHVTFVHYQATLAASLEKAPDDFQRYGIECRTIIYPMKKNRPLRWIFNKILHKISILLFKWFGILTCNSFSEHTIGLKRELEKLKSDVYFAHNFEALLPAFLVAKQNNSLLIFDCMEFYSGMGDGQTKLISQAIIQLERRCLPYCKLVTTASPELSSAYESIYGLNSTFSSYNASKYCEISHKKVDEKLNLYWRNGFLGFGQRGLEDILLAMAKLPSDVHLYLQGHLDGRRGNELYNRIEELGIHSRVSILPPHAPGEAAISAARFDIGLCLERLGPRNHELTVSNKMFDYHMAGLAVIAPDLPGLSAVLKRSGGGILYRPGSVEDLCEKIEFFRENKEQLRLMQKNARNYAVHNENMEIEIEKIAAVLKKGMDEIISKNIGSATCATA